VPSSCGNLSDFAGSGFFFRFLTTFDTSAAGLSDFLNEGKTRSWYSGSSSSTREMTI